MTLTKAIKVLTQCEADLRALVAAAAESADYDAVLRITSWAKQLASMLGTGPSVASERAPLISSPKRVPVRPTYPRFLRRGDQLVKIGWSKRERREYEHKAPRQTTLTLARAIADVAKDGRIFQVNSLLPLIDPKEGSEIPDYQVYLVIAWWRSAGLLDQHGRQGYSVPNERRLQEAVESAWLKLPED